MARWERWLRHAAVVVCGLAISACGGGGGSDEVEQAAPQITGQPTSITVVDGATAQFTVGASGVGTLSYQWRKNNQPISGATTASLSFPADHAIDNGASYTVVVSNGGGNTTSSAAALTVTPVAASIAVQPADVLVEAGLPATFSVQVDAGTQPLSYQWQRDGVAIAGATAASYTLPTTPAGDSGAQFGVEVSNAAGTTSSVVALLTVSSTPLPPTISSQPQTTTVNAGAVASFSVMANGSGALAYQWQRDGSAIAGATSASYTTPAATANDEGAVYTVLVSNAVGSNASAAATLHVNSAPLISTQPQAAALYVGQTATFSVVARGTAPLSYQWQRNGTAIAGATAASYSLSGLALSDSGASFAVVVSNALGSVTSEAAALTVAVAPAAPVITTQPQDVEVSAGSSASFRVSASSASALSFQWRKNGVAIPGATAASYTTDALVYADSGSIYSVLVSSAASSVTSANALLTVTPRVIHVNATAEASTALREDGSVIGWGPANQLAVGNTVVRTGAIVQASNQDGSPFVGVAQLSRGESRTLVIKSDGTIWGWGDNPDGALGDRTVVSRTHPVQAQAADGTPFTGASHVVSARRHTLAAKADGTVWAWGYNFYGTLGNGTKTDSLVPVQVLTAANTPLTNVVQIAANQISSLALRSDGTVWAWGKGALGNGTAVDATSVFAVRVETTPGVPLSNVVAIAQGGGHSIAVLSEGTVFGWGAGAVGDGVSGTRLRPTQIVDAAGAPFTGVASVAAGFNFTLFLKTDGSLWSVGQNASGALGIGLSATTGTAALRLNPVPVTASTGGAFVNVAQVRSYEFHVIALKNDGTVWTWGRNTYGELGDGTTTSRSSPYQVPIAGR
jgi:alpha-tubulin suppressor-like RCC1 family protein